MELYHDLNDLHLQGLFMSREVLEDKELRYIFFTGNIDLNSNVMDQKYQLAIKILISN